MLLQFGIDHLLNSESNWNHKSIGFLTNDAAKTNTGKLSRLALKEAGYNLKKIFSPEHGITSKGIDGQKMEDSLDPITDLPIISLYGEKWMPTAKDLVDIDILLFDIPDAGTRFYTYVWSMTYWIEAAAKYNKEVIILDRPNPLSGNLDFCEGPMLDSAVSSFIGRFNIPIKHQCTLGELANYFNTSEKWKANLTVIPCKGWERTHLFFDWNLPWVAPSPALQNIESTFLYPGLCFFEATNVSVGRGTPYSFEWIGATWFNLPALEMIWQNILREDIKIETLKLPIQAKDAIVETKGIRIKVINPYQYDAVLNGLLILKLIKDIHPNEFKWMPYPTHANPSGNNHLSLLLGIPNAESIFDLPLNEWLKEISILIKVAHWKNNIKSYLLYK